VLVVLERVNSHVEVSVTDTGMGIRPEFLPFVFERFRQQDASTTRKHGGLGLGLSIVKHLTELHGGSVRAKSPGEGQGATFSVALPLSAVRHPSDSESREHPAGARPDTRDFQSPNLRGVKVLVVDDDRDAREVIGRMFADSEATILTAASATEGLEILQRERPHVLVSDIGMPGMDGYEFARRVRKLPPTDGGATPAIALTAFARSEDRRRALIAGFQMHVAKPVEPAELLTVCASLAGARFAASSSS
jgi:CheY-like chemotaxis protein